jgi:putative hydrolase of the HAD superfamily
MPRSTGNKIQGVLFDMGGTLLDMQDFPALEQIARGIGIPVDADTLAHWTSEMTYENDRQGETWSWHDFLGRVLDGAVGRPVPEAQRSAFIDAASSHQFPAHLYSDARICLDELTESKLKLGVVTNFRSEQSARELLAHASVLGYFGTVVASGTEKVAKPDPELFRRGVHRLGVAPNTVLYVGDKPFTDVRAAEKAGLHGLWLHRDGTGYGEDPPEITSLAEVPIWITQFEVSGRGFSRGTSEPETAADDAERVPQRPRRRIS